MYNINGFFLSLKLKSLDIDSALKIMNYRAWKGFDIKKFHDTTVGICLTNENEYNNIIHGEIYNPINFSDEIDKLAKDLSISDGNYTFAIPDDDSVIFARDPLGTKPLYYAKNHNHFLLSTDPNVLTFLGFKANSVEPGYLYKASIKHMKRIKFNPIKYEIKNYDLKEAIETTTKLLSESIKHRTRDRKVVLGFGGGIDSTILAKLAPDVLTVTVCMENSFDQKLGKDSADMLNVNHETLLIDEKIVKQCISDLKKVMRFRNTMQASIACIVNILAKYTKEKNYDALMLGQLADELFAGYARYVRYLRISTNKVKHALFNDVKNAYRDNFERDEVASSFYTSLLLPYTGLDFVKYAVKIPLKWKLDKTGKRKIILREVAKNLDIPDTLLSREKKAMQFSTGIHKIVSRLNLN